MNTLKKLTQIIFLIIGMLGSVFSGAYLIVNLIEIPEKIRKTQHVGDYTENVGDDLYQGEDLKITNNTAKSYDHNPSEIYNFFKVISVDLSAVTPFLFFWYFSTLFLNTVKTIGNDVMDNDIIKKFTNFKVFEEEDLYERVDTLPLPESYETTWIQLGFVGTLWGFMIIGLRMKEVSATESAGILDILLKAFGTALLSTFTAVVMVYVIAPITKGLWQWMLDIESKELVADQDIEQQLRKLSLALKNTTEDVKDFNSKGLKSAVDTIEEFNDGLEGVTGKTENFANKLENIIELSEKLNTGLKNITKGADELNTKLGVVSGTAEGFNTGLRNVTKGAEGLNNGFGEVTKMTGVLNTSLNNTSEKTEQLNTRMENAAKGTEEFTTGLTTFTKTTEDLTKEVEVLKEKISTFSPTQIVELFESLITKLDNIANTILETNHNTQQKLEESIEKIHKGLRAKKEILGDKRSIFFRLFSGRER